MAPDAYPGRGVELGGDQPEAVVLHLMKPIGVRRNLGGAGRDARLEKVLAGHGRMIGIASRGAKGPAFWQG